MEKSDYEKLREITFRKEEYSPEEAKKHLESITGEHTFKSIKKILSKAQLKPKGRISKEDMFTMIAFFLDASHEPKILLKRRTIRCKLKEIRGYL